MSSNWEQITHQGKLARLYPDGSVRNEQGHMIVPLPGKHTITQADASTLAKKRRDNYRRAAVKRIVGEAQSIDPTVSTGADAFALVASKQFVALVDFDKPRIDELEKLGQIMTGYDPREKQEQGDASVHAVRGIISDLARMIEALPRQNDGLVTETGIPVSNNKPLGSAHSSADESADSLPH